MTMRPLMTSLTGNWLWNLQLRNPVLTIAPRALRTFLVVVFSACRTHHYHYLLAITYHAATHLAMPAGPNHAGPCQASPAETYLAQPCLAQPCLPRLSSPNPATPARPSHAYPHRTRPCLPHLAAPHHARPRLPHPDSPQPAGTRHTCLCLTVTRPTTPRLPSLAGPDPRHACPDLPYRDAPRRTSPSLPNRA